jgi:long-chain acyl-CoA synthetase
MPWRLAEIVRKHARERGGAPVLTLGGRTMSWAELDARSSRAAQGLVAAGVGPQDRIAFIDKNGLEYFDVLFGGAKVNAVNVAVNWRLAPGEMRYIVNDAQAKVLFVGREFAAHLAEFERDLETVKKIVVIGDHPRHDAYDAWLARYPADDPRVPAADSDVAMQLYTSGTTGLPKGAMLGNDNLGALLPHVSPRWGFDATSVNVVAMPLFHIGGSGWALCGMWNGAHSIVFREFVPAEILTAISKHRITNALFVPAMLQFMSALPGAADGDYSTLRSIVYGASPITDEVLVRAMKTLRIVDPATEQDCPTGAVGELWTRSVQNMKGYWGKPEETARTIRSDGWLRTGDAGYVDADGYIYLTDRVKDMIVSGGENIYPAEIENVLMSHPAVADVAVIGVPDDRWGETVKAIVVAQPGMAPEPGEIIAFARARLAHFKCPTSVDFAPTLPRNPSGKLLKRALREPYWAGHARRIH